MNSNSAYLRFWGVRGSYAAPYNSHMQVGGNTSCIEICADNHTLICDAGTGIIPLGNRLMKSKQNRELFIVLSHYHWDHINGLPFFVPAFSPDWKISILGPGDSPEDVAQAVGSQMKSPYFPVGTENWRARIEYKTYPKHRFEFGPLTVRYQSVHHPGLTYGYQISVGGRIITYIPDNECMFMEKTLIQKGSKLNDEEKTYYDLMKDEEYESELELSRGADILIHDSQYTFNEYEQKQGWGHSCYLDTVQSALDANVKLLFLFHHDPAHDDKFMEEIRKDAEAIVQMSEKDMRCFVAREGMRIKIGNSSGA